jgi:hypothetical protein
MVFGFLRKKDDHALEFRRNLVVSEVSADTQGRNPEQEYIAMMGRAGFLLHDNIAMSLLLDNKGLQSLVPILSPVNSPIKLDKHQSELKRIRIDNHITLLKLTMDPEVYEANGLEMLEGYRMYGHDRVSGAEEGWIGHIATEQVRVIRSEELKRKA